jgi:hypothetical protein
MWFKMPKALSKNRIHTRLTATDMEIIANTDLLTYVPDLRYHRRSEHFAMINSSAATISRDTGLIWRQQQPLPPLAVELLSHLRTCLREAADDAYSRTAVAVSDAGQ